jgi:hypothetical protein
MKWLLILLVFFVGCDNRSINNSHNKDDKPVISGVLTNIIACHEGVSTTTLFLEFEDGRIAKFRTKGFDYVVFRKNVVNKIYVDSNNIISSVEFDSELMAEKEFN